MAKIIEERPWLWATHIWNMFDFGCDARNEGGVAGRNNKGLMTFDRLVKKDSFYLYQAYWSKEPMIHLCGKRYAKRTQDQITLKVYSNLPEVELIVNGASFGTQDGYRVFTFTDIPLAEGITTITARSGGYSDTTCFEKVAEPLESYRFVEDESEMGVTNWFEHADLETEREMTFHKDFFSIHDSMEELLKDQDASDILVNSLSSLMNMRLKKSMLGIMGGQKFSDMTKSSLFPQEKMDDLKKSLAYINEKLQEIPKKLDPKNLKP